MDLRVDVVSDVICPWCFVGKRRLEQALRRLPEGVRPQVVWHPFELNPEMPADGLDRRAYREAKFGSLEASQAIDARLAEVGKAEGILFAFDRIRRTPNTRNAHRLIWLAHREAVQDAVVEHLFRAYFLEGADIGQRAVLVDVAAAAGLDHAQAEEFLSGTDGAAAVREAEAEALALGIQGVPHFIIDGKYAISGAQSAPVFATAFARVLAEEPAPPAASTPGRAPARGS